jgi:hypothetical protein
VADNIVTEKNLPERSPTVSYDEELASRVRLHLIEREGYD